MTYPEVHRETPRREPPSTRNGESEGRVSKLKPYAVGVFVARGVHPEVPTQDVVCGLRKYLGEVFRQLAEQKESRVEEGHLMSDHVHMMLRIPPKYAVSQVVGFIKGKSAIHLARVYGERKRNFVGQHFWARRYFVSTVGRDEQVIRAYIRNQEQEDQRLDQLQLLR